MSNSSLIPSEYNDICPSLREELSEAFENYFVEQCSEAFQRGIWEYDNTTLMEVEDDLYEFMHDYVLDILMDEC